MEDLLAERGLDISYETVRKVGLEIRSGLCAADSTSAATTDRTVAPGRDGRRNSRETLLSLACRGQRGRSAGFPDSVPQEHEGRDSVDAQIVEEAGLCAIDNRHR